jgi:hypothetical protein
LDSLRRFEPFQELIATPPPTKLLLSACLRFLRPEFLCDYPIHNQQSCGGKPGFHCKEDHIEDFGFSKAFVEKSRACAPAASAQFALLAAAYYWSVT